MQQLLPRLGAVLLSATCVALATAASAGAATMTRTFAPVAAAQTFDVPAGVTSLEVTAVGARGGFGGASPGGYGARVTGTVAVTPGQRLWIMVGGNGNSARMYLPPAGWNGGAPSGGTSQHYDAGEGGGASDVRRCAPGAPTEECGADDPLGRLLIAGGGGGAGGNAMSPYDANGAGGNAGAAGATASDTARGPAGGGGAGGSAAGGAAGSSGGGDAPAAAGTLGRGGGGATGYDGGQHPGGGGGGGRYGGGGGGSVGYYAGGGGGGSSLVPAGGTESTDATGSGQITLSWEVGAPATIDRPTLAQRAILADGRATTTVEVVVRDAAGAPVRGADVSFSATAPAPQLGAVTDNGDGSYSATVTAGEARGSSAITAQLATPAQTSEAVALDQVVLPTVEATGASVPAIGQLPNLPTVTLSGTADPLTEQVALHCVGRFGARSFTGAAAAVAVLDGRWSVADVTPPQDPLGNNACRLVALPVGVPAAQARALPGPHLRQLIVSGAGAPMTSPPTAAARSGCSGTPPSAGSAASAASWRCAHSTPATCRAAGGCSAAATSPPPPRPSTASPT